MEALVDCKCTVFTILNLAYTGISSVKCRFLNQNVLKTGFSLEIPVHERIGEIFVRNKIRFVLKIPVRNEFSMVKMTLRLHNGQMARVQNSCDCTQHNVKQCQQFV